MIHLFYHIDRRVPMTWQSFSKNLEQSWKEKSCLTAMEILEGEMMLS